MSSKSQSRTYLATPDGVQQLNAAKKRLNLTFKALAEQAGVSVSTIRKLWHPEKGDRITERMVVAIATVLELSWEELVIHEDSHPEENPESREGWAEAKQRIEQAQTTQATTLDLSGLQLTEVPKELAQLSNLTKLFLHQNQLTEVPKELAQLSNLTKLFLYQNQLTEVPKELAQLSNLTELSLSQNQLTEVPKELA